jgi:hypothetical protein
MVKTYDFIECAHFGGEYVRYEDYERLKQEFMDYVVIKEKEIAHLEAMLEVADDNR